MSKSSYEISFYRTDVRIEELMRIARRSMTQTATVVKPERREAFAGLQWTSVSVHTFEGPQVPTALFEVKLPNELTEDVGVKDEKALVSIGENSIRVTITDASLSSQRCDEVAVKVAQRIYQQVTGKPIPRSSILLKPTHQLLKNICEHCMQTLDTFPYRCNVCGRCFCYEHKNPETHGCFVGQKVSVPEKARIETAHGPRSAESSRRPRVIVQRVPCG
jgi:hypothetical protein